MRCDVFAPPLPNNCETRFYRNQNRRKTADRCAEGWWSGRNEKTANTEETENAFVIMWAHLFCRHSSKTPAAETSPPRIRNRLLFFFSVEKFCHSAYIALTFPTTSHPLPPLVLALPFPPNIRRMLMLAYVVYSWGWSVVHAHNRTPSSARSLVITWNRHYWWCAQVAVRILAAFVGTRGNCQLFWAFTRGWQGARREMCARLSEKFTFFKSVRCGLWDFGQVDSDRLFVSMAENKEFVGGALSPNFLPKYELVSWLTVFLIYKLP